MRLIAVAVAALLAAGAWSANAEPRETKAKVSPPPGSTMIYSRDETGRVRTKVLVQKRSYLDGGTEVMPGDIQTHQTNFIGMNQNPTRVISNDNIVPTHPIPDPFFLPGRDNPYFR